MKNRPIPSMPKLGQQFTPKQSPPIQNPMVQQPMPQMQQPMMPQQVAQPQFATLPHQPPPPQQQSTEAQVQEEARQMAMEIYTQMIVKSDEHLSRKQLQEIATRSQIAAQAYFEAMGFEFEGLSTDDGQS